MSYKILKFIFGFALMMLVLAATLTWVFLWLNFATGISKPVGHLLLVTLGPLAPIGVAAGIMYARREHCNSATRSTKEKR